LGEVASLSRHLPDADELLLDPFQPPCWAAASSTVDRFATRQPRRRRACSDSRWISSQLLVEAKAVIGRRL